MKVLQVIHDFLPRHTAGSEIYTFHLCREIAKRHAVHVLYTECRHGEPQYRSRRGTYEGLPFTEVVHLQAYPSFEATYRDEQMNRAFVRVIEEFRPDVVHLQHLQYHSMDYIDIAHRSGIPIVYTLHEYCLICPRKGLMMREDSRLCAAASESICADCMANDSMAPLVFSREKLRRDAWVKARIPARLRRMVRKRLVKYGFIRDGGGERRNEPLAKGRDHRAEIRERLRYVRERCGKVDLFVAPSPFLRSKMIEFGIPEERIVFSDYGFVAAPFQGLRRKPSEVLRVAFIGTLVDFKGAHLLLEASALLSLPVRRRLDIRVYGDSSVFPRYTERLRPLALEGGARFMGRFENGAVAEILSDVDVLVVPSLWYENSPLTIHEAFLAGIPVITSRLGGMADLVNDGVNGLLFERGSASDLARCLERLVAEPGLHARLASGIGAVKTIAEDAAYLEGQYERLLEARRPGGGGKRK